MHKQPKTNIKTKYKQTQKYKYKQSNININTNVNVYRVNTEEKKSIANKLFFLCIFSFLFIKNAVLMHFV